MALDKRRKIAMAGFCLPLLIAAILLLFNIPVIWIVAVSTIIPGIIIAIILGWISFERQPTGKKSKNYFGWILSKKSAYIAIGALIIGSVFYFGIYEVPNEVITADQLFKDKVYGNCQVQDNEYVCIGPWKVFVRNLKNVNKLNIIPGSEPFREMLVLVGPYKVEYSQGDLKQLGGTVCGYARYKDDSGKVIIYHRALIYYLHEGRYLGAINSCLNVPVPQGMAPENLYIGTNWIFRYLLPEGEDPQVFVGWDEIATSDINIDRQILLGGDITLSGNQGVRIKSLNLVFS